MFQAKVSAELVEHSTTDIHSTAVTPNDRWAEHLLPIIDEHESMHLIGNADASYQRGIDPILPHHVPGQRNNMAPP